MEKRTNSNNFKAQQKTERISNVFSIAPGLPFLKTLASELIEGQLIAGFTPIDDPSLLAQTTVYLPTRRAARAFALELLSYMNERCGVSAVLLPHIRTIGDLDDEEVLEGFAVDSELSLDIGKPINSQRRQLILASFAKSWSNALNDEQRELLQEEDIVLPSSAGDAVRLASNLAAFMDQVETEEVDWQELETLNDDEYQQWWQITLAFLRIIMKEWPNFLASIEEINPAAFRQKHTDFRIDQLQNVSKKGPVIIAGSTGSIPATARLIKAVADLENGAVILPGIDHEFPEDIFDVISKGTEENGESIYSTHPQFGLARLANQLNEKPKNIVSLGELPSNLKLREKLLNISLLPPEGSANWFEVRSSYKDDAVEEAFEHLSLINAAGERQEALAIALLFRQALEVPNKTAALVTPDRNLARRVASELERFGIEVDDSGGAPLANSPTAMFLRQLLKCVFEPVDATAFSSFIKNDFLQVGYDTHQARQLAELLELLLIRDALSLPGVNLLEDACETALGELENNFHAPSALRKMNDDTKAQLIDFASLISEATSDLFELSQGENTLTIDQVLASAANAIEQLNQTTDGSAQVFATPSGKELFEFLNSYKNIDCSNFQLKPFDVVTVVDALLSEKKIRNPERTHPRLHIYGPLEARLQTSDLMILGGLNEGTWPQVGSNDPFLNRPMRAELGLPLPERRIGLSAHDFQQLLGNEEVVITRSNRVDNAPTVASRWVQRVTTFLGKEQALKITSRGDQILQLVELIDHVVSEPISINPPRPTPPVATRPNKMSITDIEKWIRDPYAIYAKHILKLKPLPPLQRKSDAALKGNLYHDIVAGFVDAWKGPIDASAYVKFNEIADLEFSKLGLADEIKSVWRPRFDNVAIDFLEEEKIHHSEINQSYCEIEVESDAKIDELDFYLRGRADRINLLKDGSLEVVDYKTGLNPSAKQARTIAPQLSLEGALAQKGLFKNVKAASVSKLAYIRLREGAFKIDDISRENRKTIPIDEIITDAWENLKEHIKAYQKPEQGYISRYAPVLEANKSGDYDHLARVREWSLDDGELEGGDE